MSVSLASKHLLIPGSNVSSADQSKWFTTGSLRLGCASLSASPFPSFRSHHVASRLKYHITASALSQAATETAFAEPSVLPTRQSSVLPAGQTASLPAGRLSAAAIAATDAASGVIRNDWTKEEVQAIYDCPVMDLLFHGAQVHRAVHNFREVQQCTLLSIKTGGCSEDCSYCPQSAKYSTGVKSEPLMKEDEVMEAARKAKKNGSTRFCMGAAWRSTQGRNSNFTQILEYVRNIRALDMEVCCTLGMLEEAQAQQLAEAGLTAYNHNLDTSREYYPKVITTRTYDDRLETLRLVREAGISVCCGGIIGMGESPSDRVGLLHTLSTLPEHPESVPINSLIAVKGTPMQDQPKTEIWEMIRMIATARIVMPKAMVRLSAGRVELTIPEQALCFMAGANSIFVGEKLLTTPNNEADADSTMFATLGLIPMLPDTLRDKAAAAAAGREGREGAAAEPLAATA